MKVYLAGGMRNGWREVVKRVVPTHTYSDPSLHGLITEKEYTEWDLAAIRDADVVFGYMEFDNPSGIGLSNEIGYAYALGKYIIFVDESSEAKSVYMGMCRVEATMVFSLLREAIDHLASLTYANMGES